MRKTLFALTLLAVVLFALPAQAQLKIDTMVNEQGMDRIVSMIMANPAIGQEELSEEENAQLMQALVDANLLIQTRFALGDYLVAFSRVGDHENERSIYQTPYVYQDGRSASIAVRWQGEQADGTHGSTVSSLALNLETGAEITFEELFTDAEEAAAAMETLISEEIMDGLSDYMEYADLLPMPRDCFSYDENGLTVYYPEERYLYFSGRSGAVHFAWHELSEFIGEDSPVYALSRRTAGDALGIAEQIATGRLPGAMPFGLGDLLGGALAELTLLADPDYTTDSLAYQFEEEALRGWTLEIPKYAETDEEETPISAVRTTRIDFGGLVTGETTRALAIGLLGEPEQTRSYDEDDAADRLLIPGESLLYSLGGHVLQLHFEESGVLDLLSIRMQFPD